MSALPENPHLRRRRAPGLLARLGPWCLKPWLWLLRKGPRKKAGPLTVFQSYMVGDLYLALPALKTLALACGIRVICRPDCREILRAEGLDALPFENAFFVRPRFSSFLSTLRGAWELRGKLGPMALDFDADPRSALWMRVAGTRRAVSHASPYAGLFDRTFPLPGEAPHQADKNAAVAQGFLARPGLRKGLSLSPPRPLAPEAVPAPILDSASAPWIVSCLTRRDTKNWPLDRWDSLLEKMAAARLPLLILDAPEGGADFRRFRERWSAQVGFLRGPLPQISGYVRNSAGVVATDNFLGHMAAYYGKPVLWINGSSDPLRVMPQGPLTGCVQVEPMPCRPCDHRCTNPKHRECLETLRVEEVWKAFEDLRRFSHPT